MKSYRVISGILPLFLFVVLSACGSDTEAVDTTGLGKVALRIEGMT